MGSIPGSGRSPGGGNGNRFQFSCQENPMDRGAWWAMVHGVTESGTQLKWLSSSIPAFIIKLKHRACPGQLLSESHSVMSDSLQPHGLYSPWNSPGQNTGVDNRSLLQRIFLTQELNWGLLHCRWILYQLSSQGSLSIYLSLYISIECL